jgi:hypothetical protein
MYAGSKTREEIYSEIANEWAEPLRTGGASEEHIKTEVDEIIKKFKNNHFGDTYEKEIENRRLASGKIDPVEQIRRLKQYKAK